MKPHRKAPGNCAGGLYDEVLSGGLEGPKVG